MILKFRRELVSWRWGEVHSDQQAQRQKSLRKDWLGEQGWGGGGGEGSCMELTKVIIVVTIIVIIHIMFY